MTLQLLALYSRTTKTYLTEELVATVAAWGPAARAGLEATTGVLAGLSAFGVCRDWAGRLGARLAVALGVVVCLTPTPHNSSDVALRATRG